MEALEISDGRSFGGAFAGGAVPEDIIAMVPGPRATSLLPPIAGNLGMPLQGGVKVVVKRDEGAPTKLDELLI